MECPKCHNEVNDNTAVCPFCKKVLLLKCPICGKFNKNSTCEECGYVIISRCNNCGKINQTIDGKCVKCGFDTYKSIILNESETEDFACFIINFANLRDIKNAINSMTNYNKFYKKLKTLVFEFAKGLKLRATLTDGNFIINFYKDYSFHASANNAVKSTIELVNKLVQMNYRLKKNFSVVLECKIVILKKSVDDASIKNKSGLNVKLLNIKNEKNDYLSGIQVITDQFIYKIASKNFEMASLYSTQINNELVSFYELLLSKYVMIPENDEQDEDETSKLFILPQLNKSEKEETEEIDLYDFNKIDIETNCTFLRSTSVGALDLLDTNLDKYRIISLKSSLLYAIDTSDLFSLFKTHYNTIVHLKCLERLKYNPFGIWREFLKSYTDLERNSAFNLRVRTKLPDTDALLRLINGEITDSVSPENERFKYFEAIYSVLENVEDKLVIFIENFEIMDSTSQELFNYIFERIDNTNITFIFTTAKTEAIHKKIHNLTDYEKYLEITINKSKWNEILLRLPIEIRQFTDSFYFERIKENFDGSYAYFKNAIKYLEESKILVSMQGKYKLKEDKISVLPEDLVDLIQKRIRLLSKHSDAYNIILYSYFLGPRIDNKIISILGIKDLDKTSELLEQRNFIGISRASLYIQNYHLLKLAIERMFDESYLKELAENIYEKVYINSEVPSSVKLTILSTLEMKKEMYMEHCNLARFALSYGDFSAYVKNVVKFFDIIDKKKTSELSKIVEEFKKSVYSNVVMYLDTAFDDEAKAVINVLLEDALKMNDTAKIINLSNITLKNSLHNSDYPLALISLHNILTRLPEASLVDSKSNYNPKFLSLLLINIEILFNLGELSKCLEITNAVLQELTPEVCIKIKPESYSIAQFEDYILNTMSLSGIAKLMTCEKDLEKFLDTIKERIGKDIPARESLLALQSMIQGNEFKYTPVETNDFYAKFLTTIICAFKSFDGDYEALAKSIHIAKDIASASSQRQFGLFCDLIIGYCYYRLGVEAKSEAIYSDVMKEAKRSGLSTIVHFVNYFTALAEIELRDRDTAYGLVMNSLLILERSDAQNRIIISMLQLLLLKILTLNPDTIGEDEFEENVQVEGQLGEQVEGQLGEQAGEEIGAKTDVGIGTEFNSETKTEPKPQPIKSKFSKEILDTPEGYKLNRMLTEFNLRHLVELLI